MPSDSKILMSYTKVLLQMASQFTCRAGSQSRNLDGIDHPEFCTQLTYWLKKIKTPESRILASMVQPADDPTRGSDPCSTTGERINVLPGDNMTLRLNYADFLVAAVTLYEQLIISGDRLKEQRCAAEYLSLNLWAIAGSVPGFRLDLFSHQPDPLHLIDQSSLAVLDLKALPNTFRRLSVFCKSVHQYLVGYPAKRLHRDVIAWAVNDVRPDLFNHGDTLAMNSNLDVFGMPRHIYSYMQDADEDYSILHSPNCQSLLKRAVVLRRRCQEAGWDFSSSHLGALSSGKGDQAHANRLLDDGKDLIFAAQLLEYIVEHNQVSSQSPSK